MRESSDSFPAYFGDDIQYRKEYGDSDEPEPRLELGHDPQDVTGIQMR